MAKQRKLTPERKAFTNRLLEHYRPETAQDVQEIQFIFTDSKFHI